MVRRERCRWRRCSPAGRLPVADLAIRNDPARLAVGDRITVRTSETDPIEICLHHHAVVIAVTEADDGPTYLVGHPGMSHRRYGPYREDRLSLGWDSP